MKSLDVVELQLTPNPAYDDKRISVGDRMYVDPLISPWICPITELEMSGRFKTVFLCSSCRVVALAANLEGGNSQLGWAEEVNSRGNALTDKLAVRKLLREVIASWTELFFDLLF